MSAPIRQRQPDPEAGEMRSSMTVVGCGIGDRLPNRSRSDQVAHHTRPLLVAQPS